MQTKYAVIRRCMSRDEFITIYDEDCIAESHAELDDGYYVMRIFLRNKDHDNG